MPVLGFKAQFEAPILAGTKRQTCRLERKDKRPHCKGGDIIDMVVGNRTPQRRVFARVHCAAYDPLTMWFGPDRSYCIGNAPEEAAHFRLDAFARADGFADWAALEEWFAAEHGCGPGSPFRGFLIRWYPPQVEAKPAPRLLTEADVVLDEARTLLAVRLPSERKRARR